MLEYVFSGDLYCAVSDECLLHLVMVSVSLHPYCKHMCSWSDQLVLFLSAASWTSDGQYFAVGMQNGSVSIRNKVNVCE